MYSYQSLFVLLLCSMLVEDAFGSVVVHRTEPIVEEAFQEFVTTSAGKNPFPTPTSLVSPGSSFDSAAGYQPSIVEISSNDIADFEHPETMELDDLVGKLDAEMDEVREFNRNGTPNRKHGILEYYCYTGTLCILSVPYEFAHLPNANSIEQMYGSEMWMYMDNNKDFMGVPFIQGRHKYAWKQEVSNEHWIELAFEIIVTNFDRPSHLFKIVMKKPSSHQFNTVPRIRFDFIKTLSSALKGSRRSITLESIRSANNKTIVLFFNNTISNKECKKEEIDELASKMFFDDGRLAMAKFLNAMGPEYFVRSVSLIGQNACQGVYNAPSTVTETTSKTTITTNDLSKSTATSKASETKSNAHLLFFVGLLILAIGVIAIVYVINCCGGNEPAVQAEQNGNLVAMEEFEHPDDVETAL